MTREAKIGMLTGLGVIVLIGVLLSEYLGDPKDILTGTAPTTPTANGPTGRMAELPIGTEYRRQQLQPISVPNMGQPLAGGNEMKAPFSTNNAVIPAYGVDSIPAAPPADQAGAGPTISMPVAPIPMGPSPMDDQLAAAGPATFRVADAPRPGDIKPPAAAPTGTTYVILAGDNLAKIAKKFYNSSKQSDVQRIVSANPAMLKDASTTLIAGKKLTIPNIAPTPAQAISPKPSTPPAKASDVTVRKNDPVMIYLPGPLDSDTRIAQSDPPKSAPTPTIAKSSAKTYTVKSGDTLEKIAKLIAPANTTATIEKLKTTNAIKDVHNLQVGQILKLPA